MKKGIVTLLVLVLSLSLCITAIAQESTEPINLTVAWWGSQTRADVTQAALKLYASENENVVFDGQFFAFADYWNKLATAAAGHTMPDVIQMDYKYLSQYVSNGLLADLTPYIEDGTLDVSGVDQSVLDSGKVGDGLYALCIGINAPSLIYNKTLLDANGIAIKDNMSMEEFVALCREVYEKTGYKTNICYNNGTTWAEFQMRAKGIVLFQEDKLGGTQEDLEEIFSIYEQGIKEGWHVEPSVFAEVSIGQPEQEPLVYGSTPASMSWCAFYYSNNMTALQNAAPEGVELGITTWPSDEPQKANFLKPAMFFAVTVDSKAPEAAAKFLNYWTNSVECNKTLVGERGVPVSAAVAAEIKDSMSAVNQTVVNYINNVVTPNCSVINPPVPSAASEVYQLIYQLQEKVCYGAITAQEAAAELFEQGNAIMAGK
ncbi:MAG: extracellular solute-binding protein [Eubacteriales bacterium]|nr:extracellular solute-binding protein [Eubacteriales bacterium]